MTAPGYAVVPLRGGAASGRVDPAVLGDVFAAPWRAVELVTLPAGGVLGPRRLEDSEVMVLVTAGTGEAHLGSGPVALHDGVSLTLFLGEQLHVVAHDPLELFLVEMGVRA